MQIRNPNTQIMAAWVACLLNCLSAATAAETVTVNLAADGGEILHRASGFLHGFSNDGRLPPDSMIAPLKARLHRTRPGTTWVQAERMKKLGIETGKIAHVLLGNKGGLQGDVKVSFQGLDKAAYLRDGDRIHVVVERIPEDKGGAVTAVQTVIDARLPIRDNSLDVTIPWTSDRDAFAVRLGPGRQ